METTKTERQMQTGTWVRRMTLAEFRVMEPGMEVQVVIDCGEEVQNLRSAASRAERKLGKKFTVRYSRGDSYALVTCP